jgi:hypothetical protein
MQSVWLWFFFPCQKHYNTVSFVDLRITKSCHACNGEKTTPEENNLRLNLLAQNSGHCYFLPTNSARYCQRREIEEQYSNKKSLQCNKPPDCTTEAASRACMDQIFWLILPQKHDCLMKESVWSHNSKVQETILFSTTSKESCFLLLQRRYKRKDDAATSPTPPLSLVCGATNNISLLRQQKREERRNARAEREVQASATRCSTHSYTHARFSAAHEHEFSLVPMN